jgi:hypothetical protein
MRRIQNVFIVTQHAASNRIIWKMQYIKRTNILVHKARTTTTARILDEPSSLCLHYISLLCYVLSVFSTLYTRLRCHLRTKQMCYGFWRDCTFFSLVITQSFTHGSEPTYLAACMCYKYYSTIQYNLYIDCNVCVRAWRFIPNPKMFSICLLLLLLPLSAYPTEPGVFFVRPNSKKKIHKIICICMSTFPFKSYILLVCTFYVSACVVNINTIVWVPCGIRSETRVTIPCQDCATKHILHEYNLIIIVIIREHGLYSTSIYEKYITWIFSLIL